MTSKFLMRCFLRSLLVGLSTVLRNFFAKLSAKGNLSIASNIFFLKSTGFLLPLKIFTLQKYKDCYSIFLAGITSFGDILSQKSHRLLEENLVVILIHY